MSTHNPVGCELCATPNYEDFRHRCLHESIDKNKIWMETYSISKWPRWDYELEDATLTFSDEDKPRVICQIQVAGSTQGDTWEWSWANHNTPEISRAQMCVAHELGAQKEWDRLTTMFLPNDEFVGWEGAAIANHLLGGVGAYRCPRSDSKRDDGLVDATYVVILSAEFVN